jgi:hypothetical protein
MLKMSKRKMVLLAAVLALAIVAVGVYAATVYTGTFTSTVSEPIAVTEFHPLGTPILPGATDYEGLDCHNGAIYEYGLQLTVTLNYYPTGTSFSYYYSTDEVTWVPYTLGNTVNILAGTDIYFKILVTVDPSGNAGALSITANVARVAHV